jgi:hypothetical protein
VIPWVWRLEVCELVAATGDDLVIGRPIAWLELHEGAGRLMSFRIRARDDGGELEANLFLPFPNAS